VSIQVSQPARDAVLRGSVQIKGSAGDDAAAVGVSIGGGPFVTAKGTTAWSLTVDTTTLPNGPATIVVAARALGGLENIVSRPVTIDNTDRLVGIWRNATLRYRPCRLYFFASGDFVDEDCGLFNDQTTWLREGEDLVLLSGGWRSAVIGPSLSMGGKLLTLVYRGQSYVFTRVERLGIDVVDVDAGTEDDGGP
jgi:hypothetical protein